MSLPDRYYEDLLRQVVTGRGWLLAHDVLVPAARQAATLLDLGAASVFALGGSRGTGPIAEGIPTLDLGLVAGSMMEGIRASEALLDDLPPEIVARIDAWDPDREARAIRPLFSHGRPVAGRPRSGGGRAGSPWRTRPSSMPCGTRRACPGRRPGTWPWRPTLTLAAHMARP